MVRVPVPSGPLVTVPVVGVLLFRMLMAVPVATV